MGVFSFFKKSKVELTGEQKKWNIMWDLWVEGRADSPYAELMTYQSEINNGGHDRLAQYTGLQLACLFIHHEGGYGVVFLELDGMDKFDGLTMFTQKQIPVIWLNKNMPNDRKRYSLSHELGHLVMHLRSEDFDKAEETKEQEANEFASEFLMPESQCKLDLFGLKYKDLGLRKQYWKVSKAALIHRAQELNCIPAQTAQYLYIQLGRSGERKNESVNVSIDEPQILKKMTDLHVTELKYTMEELSDIVGLGVQEIKSSLMGENKTISLRPAKISLSF